jgi:hypothetical protein
LQVKKLDQLYIAGAPTSARESRVNKKFREASFQKNIVTVPHIATTPASFVEIPARDGVFSMFVAVQDLRSVTTGIAFSYAASRYGQTAGRNG